jgi:hypothetical protein
LDKIPQAKLPQAATKGRETYHLEAKKGADAPTKASGNLGSQSEWQQVSKNDSCDRISGNQPNMGARILSPLLATTGKTKTNPLFLNRLPTKGG